MITSVPSTTKISSPSTTCPPRLAPAALNCARDPADSVGQCETVAAHSRTAQAMLATAWASSVQ